MQVSVGENMKKAVLISVQPKWCELIANGNKTVEVRKTRPKLETPFKVYIYCTLQGSNEFFQALKNSLGEYEALSKWNRENWEFKKGKVIGEFVCDEIIVAELGHYCNIPCKEAQLDILDLMDYADEKTVYGWHISNLVIYDKPKELSEFYIVDNEAVKKCKHREQSYHKFTDTGYIKNGFLCMDKLDWCTKCKTKPLTRPPQSWCYVEELSE